MHDILKIEGRLVVSARANLWLSGQPAGVEIGEDSVGPDDDPKEKPVEYILQQNTRYLLISACGKSEFTPWADTGRSADSFPSGYPGGLTRVRNAVNGISGMTGIFGMLVGVFLDDTRPRPGGEPESIEIYYVPIAVENLPTVAGRHWGLLRRPFGIGAGPFFVIVPEGATRLFLGVLAPIARGPEGYNHYFSGEYYVAIVEASEER
jgi:hypothetical protein